MLLEQGENGRVVGGPAAVKRDDERRKSVWWGYMMWVFQEEGRKRGIRR